MIGIDRVQGVQGKIFRVLGHWNFRVLKGGKFFDTYLNLSIAALITAASSVASFFKGAKTFGTS